MGNGEVWSRIATVTKVLFPDLNEGDWFNQSNSLDILEFLLIMAIVGLNVDPQGFWKAYSMQNRMPNCAMLQKMIIPMERYIQISSSVDGFENITDTTTDSKHNPCNIARKLYMTRLKGRYWINSSR